MLLLMHLFLSELLHHISCYNQRIVHDLNPLRTDLHRSAAPYPQAASFVLVAAPGPRVVRADPSAVVRAVASPRLPWKPDYV